MVKVLERKTYPKRFQIDLPIKRFSLSHIGNINYCIQQIKDHSINGCYPVIGYIKVKAQGTRWDHYRGLSQEEAKELKKKNPRFGYITLEYLLNKKLDIEEGKYIIRNGLIINFNPSYSP